MHPTTMRYMNRMAALIAVLMITACGTSKSYQHVSSRVVYDTIRADRAGARTERVSDSTRIADSVIVLIQGDTIHLREVHWRTRYVSTSDTVRDTVRVYSSRTAAQIESSITQKKQGRIKVFDLLLILALLAGALLAFWHIGKKV